METFGEVFPHSPLYCRFHNVAEQESRFQPVIDQTLQLGLRVPSLLEGLVPLSVCLKQGAFEGGQPFCHNSSSLVGPWPPPPLPARHLSQSYEPVPSIFDERGHVGLYLCTELSEPRNFDTDGFLEWEEILFASDPPQRALGVPEHDDVSPRSQKGSCHGLLHPHVLAFRDRVQRPAGGPTGQADLAQSSG